MSNMKLTKIYMWLHSITIYMIDTWIYRYCFSEEYKQDYRMLHKIFFK